MLGYEMPCAISGEAALRMHHGEKGTIITPGRPDGDLRADIFRRPTAAEVR